MKKLLLLLAACVTIGAQTGGIFTGRFPHLSPPNSGISSLSLTKTSNVSTYNAVGNLITYTYTIHNTGTLPLTGPIIINDSVQGIISSCGSVPLAVNATTSCQSNHPATQNDLDNGSIVNTAVASDSNSGAFSAGSTVTVTAVQSPSISLSKVPSPSSFTTAPTTITYTYTVLNTGNVTITANVSISDNLTGNIAICQNVAPLPPQGTKVCTSQFTATTVAPVTNTATASTTFHGNPVPPSTASATVTNGLTIDITNTQITGLNNAACDGVISDTANIQAILNYASSHGSVTSSSVVTVPAGRTCAIPYVSGTFDLQIPSFVTIRGGAGSTWVGSGPGAAVLGLGIYATSWPKAGPFYNLQNTVYGSTSVTLATASFATNFHVNDIVSFYQEYPDQTANGPEFGNANGHCWNCDTVPMQTARVTGVNTATGVISIGPDTVFQAFTNNRYTAPGIGHCITSSTAPCNPSTNGNFPYTDYVSCVNLGASACTPIYQNQGNKVVIVNNTNNNTTQNVLIDTMILNGNLLFKATQSYNVTIQNSTINQTCCGMDNNANSHFSMINNTWNCTGCSTISSEGFQRSSGGLLFQNNKIGTAANPWYASFGTAEPPYNITWTGNTIFMGGSASATQCGLENGGAGVNFSGNTITATALCTATNGFLLSDDIGTGNVVSSPNNAEFYSNHQVYNNNTINCQANANAYCFLMMTADTVITNNTINLSGGQPAAVIANYAFAAPNLANGNTTNYSSNTINGMAGTTGILFNGGWTNGDFMTINNNIFNGTSGQSVTVTSSSSGSAGSCQVQGNNMRQGTIATASISDHTYCTIANN